MTTLEALEIVLKAIKERFSMKNHKHEVGDVSGLSRVAKTGKYSDLSGLPQIPSVAVAKQNKVGLVMPGDGMYVNEVGALSIVVDGESGLVIEDNILKISSNSTSSKTIEAENWNDMLEPLVNIIKENVNKNIFDFKVTLKNTRNGKSIVVKFNKDRIDNFDRIKEYVFNMLENLTEVSKSDTFAKLDGYSRNFEEFKFCEFFRLLASEDTIDCIELLLYKKTKANEALEFLGKNLTDVVKVLDIKKRYVALGLSAPDYCNNVVVTYVLKYGETGYDYVPITSAIESGETPTPTPEPEPSVKKYSISCLSYDIDIENSIEGNGYSDSIGDINRDCKLNSSKQSVELDESFEITTNVSDDRVIRSGYIIIKDDNYIPSDKIKPNYTGYIAYKFGNSGKTLSLSSLIESAKKYNPEEWDDTMPLPIYTIAKANPITKNQTDRIWKADIAQHNTWFYDFGDNTAYVNRRLYFSDDSWSKIKNTIDKTGSNIICIIVSAIKHDIKEQGFKNVYLSTDVSIETDGNGVRLVESELGDVTRWTETAETYHRQWLDSTASPLTNPRYRELNKYNSVNFSAGAGSVKTYKEGFILYKVPDEGDYKGKWIAISIDDKTGEKWSDEFIKMRNKIPSLWFLNMSGDGVSFQWTVSQYQQVFALVVEKSGDEQNRLTINYVDDKNIGVLTLQ